MKKLLLFAVAMFATYACAESDLGTTTTADEGLRTVTINVGANENDATRVAFDQDWNISWEEDDALLAWSLNSATSKLSMTNYDADFSTFEGSVSTSYFRVLYPYSTDYTFSSNLCTIDVKDQTEGATLSYMTTESLINDLETTSMKHIGAAVSLNIRFSNIPTDTTYTLTEVEVIDVPTTVQVNMYQDITSDDFYGAETIENIIVDITDTPVGSDDVEVRFNVLPFELAAGESLTIKYHMSAADGTSCYVEGTVTNKSSDVFEFARATYNTLYAYCDLSSLIELVGSGDERDPYLITTESELAALASEVYNGDNKSGIYYKLANDLDLSGYSSWMPIGTSDTLPFKGNFDGGNHTISNLTISSSDNYQGLFGYVNSGTISNLTLKGASVSAGSYSGVVCGNIYNGSVTSCGVEDSTLSGSGNVGGVVGRVYAYSTACYVTDCYNIGGTVTGSSSCVGGVIGRTYVYNYSSSSASSSITGCYNTGSVTGSSSYVGGVVGYTSRYSSSYTLNSSISECYNTGKVTGSSSYVGGIAGESYATISECHNTGTVYSLASSSYSSYVGGIAGSSYSSSITSCYNEGFILGLGNYVGGVVGTSSSTITDSYNKGAVVGQSQYVGGVAGSYSSSTMTRCYNEGSVTGSGSQVGGVVGRASSATISESYNSAAVKGSSYYTGGVVGYAESSTAISKCYNSATVTGSRYAGGVVGYLSSSTVSECLNVGDVSGSSYYIGGIAGYLTTTSTTSDPIVACYNMGSVTGSYYNVGGIVGYYDVELSCTATTKSCYNVGAVKGIYQVGGVAGYVVTESLYDVLFSYAKFNTCYNVGETTATYSTTNSSYSLGGIIGYSDYTDDSVTAENCYYLPFDVTYTSSYGTAQSDLKSTMTASGFETTLNSAAGSSYFEYDASSQNSGYPILSAIDYPLVMPAEEE